jgi:hypothetical protein
MLRPWTISLTRKQLPGKIFACLVVNRIIPRLFHRSPLLDNEESFEAEGGITRALRKGWFAGISISRGPAFRRSVPKHAGL